MGDQFDALVRQLGQRAPRRQALQVLGGLALGSLGAIGIGQAADARSCKKRCKDHCKMRHKRRGSNRQCRKHCQNRCD